MKNALMIMVSYSFLENSALRLPADANSFQESRQRVAATVAEQDGDCVIYPEDTNASPTGTLVLSYFTGYDPSTRKTMINGYFGSLRRAGHTGYQTVVHDGGFCEDTAKLYNTTCFDFHQLDLEMAARGSAKRFVYWLHYLKDYAPKDVGYVFTSDMRDVFFQANPFDMLPKTTGLVFFGEQTNILAGDCKSEARACRACKTKASRHKSRDVSFGHLPIINNGESYGTRMATTRLFHTYVNILNNHSKCWDQHLFNEMVWTGGCFNQDLFAFSETGPLCTIGAGYEQHVNSNAEVVNRKGEKCAIVHQFDRYPKLSTLYHEVYAIEGVSKSNLDAAISTFNSTQTLPFKDYKDSRERLRNFRCEGDWLSLCNSPHRMQPPYPGSPCHKCGYSAPPASDTFTPVVEMLRKTPID